MVPGRQIAFTIAILKINDVQCSVFGMNDLLNVELVNNNVKQFDDAWESTLAFENQKTIFWNAFTVDNWEVEFNAACLSTISFRSRSRQRAEGSLEIKFFLVGWNRRPSEIAARTGRPWRKTTKHLRLSARWLPKAPKNTLVRMTHGTSYSHTAVWRTSVTWTTGVPPNPGCRPTFKHSTWPTMRLEEQNLR